MEQPERTVARREHALAQAHPVLAFSEGARLIGMATFAAVETRRDDPRRGVGLRGVATFAVHARPRMHIAGPGRDRALGPVAGGRIRISGEQRARGVDAPFLLLEPIGKHHHLRIELVRFALMLDEKVAVEGAVIVKMVTARGRAGGELQSLVARTIVRNIVVTKEAEVVGQGPAHRVRNGGAVLLVAGDAILRVQNRDPVRVARIGELRLGMGIVFRLQCRAVAFDAGLLQRLAAAERTGVASIARQLDLIMAVSRAADQQLRSIAAVQDDDQGKNAHRRRQGDPEEPQQRRPRHLNELNRHRPSRRE